jgi:hypothetical protein
MSVTELQTGLILRVGQITEGDAKCPYDGCTRNAALVVAYGPIPEDEPVCAVHAVEWLELTAVALRDLWKEQF